MKNILLITIAIAALVTAGITLSKCGKTPHEAKLSLPFEMLGKVLARETLREIPGAGTIQVLRYRNALNADDPVLNPAAKSFLRSIRDDGRLSIKGVEEETFDPFMLEAGWKNTTMESARFVEYVGKHGDVDAIVIVGGTPQLDRADVSRLGSKHPKIITASVFTYPDRQLLKAGVIASAIVSRSQPSEIQTPPQSPQEWFDRRYVVWNRENIEANP